MHGIFVGVTVHYYIYSPWRRAWSACWRHCTLLHLLTMATCMECLSASLYTITSTHHGNLHRVFVGITVHYYIYSPWRRAWSVCTSTHHGDVHGVFVGVTVHGHGLDAHLSRSTYDTTRDLPSVRDQDLLYRPDSYRYNTFVLTSLYLVTAVGNNSLTDFEGRRAARSHVSQITFILMEFFFGGGVEGWSKIRGHRAIDTHFKS